MKTAEERNTGNQSQPPKTSTGHLINAALQGAGRGVWIILPALLLLFGCEKEKDDPVPAKPEVEYSVDVDLPTDPGEVGLVIHTRDIFRKGYAAATAQIAFSAYPELDTTVSIDPITNVAIVKYPNESISEDQREALAAGVAVDIKVFDNQSQLLAEYDNDGQSVDDSNTPLFVSTSMPPILPDVALNGNVAYYIQPEHVGGDGNYAQGTVLKASTPRLYLFEFPDPNPTDVTFHFRYFFKPQPDGTYFIMRDHPVQTGGTYYMGTQTGDNVLDVSEDVGFAIKFDLIQTSEGWMRIREHGTDRYITIAEGTSDLTDHRKVLRLISNGQDKFRFISAEIKWFAEDRGTAFSQSIIPPAEIEFAYAATIKNCSAGLLTQEVGNERTRESVRTLQTTESLQFFAGVTAGVSYTAGVSAGASIPGVGDVSASVEIGWSLNLETNVTTSNENTTSSQTSESSTVSRVQTLEIPPRTGVQFFDAVRVVKNARVPFTQKIRVTANYSDGTPLTGDEIRTQMMANFVSGVVISQGPNYIDVGVSGNISIDQMFETETGIHEIVNACP